MFNIDNTYLTYKRGFLRSTVVYLRDLSPYRRQFSPYSESQNTIGVNLLGNHSTSCYYVVDLSYLYTQPIDRTHRSSYYKVPLQWGSIEFGYCQIFCLTSTILHYLIISLNYLQRAQIQPIAYPSASIFNGNQWKLMAITLCLLPSNYLKIDFC